MPSPRTTSLAAEPSLQQQTPGPAPLHRGLQAPAPKIWYPKTLHLLNQDIASALRKFWWQLCIKSHLLWVLICLTQEVWKVAFLHQQFSFLVWPVSHLCKYLSVPLNKESLLYLHVTDTTEVCFMCLKKCLTLTLPLSLPTISCKSFEGKKGKKYFQQW